MELSSEVGDQPAASAAPPMTPDDRLAAVERVVERLEARLSGLAGELQGRMGEVASAVHARASGRAGGGRGRLPEHLPAGVMGAGGLMAARPLRALWRRWDGPVIERWTGPVDVVHGTNFVVPPTRAAGRVVTVHDMTPVRFP